MEERKGRQVSTINLLIGTKKSERISIGLKYLSEIKAGGTAALSYQELMAASQGLGRHLN